ncbi:hypothetical protein ABKT77_07605 [Enterobacter cloacae]|uniref:hypothetical protein n=1 Tax=Enterobacter cloacae TaxID=550 RepID=UPI0032AF5858
MKIKSLFFAAMLALTGCTATHHDFMDKAYVGYVNNHAVVLFDAGYSNGVKVYRPQFSSDCGKVYDKFYQTDNTSTTCLVRESRIADLHPYNEHIGKEIPHKADTIHDGLEGVNAPSIIPDNL